MFHVVKDATWDVLNQSFQKFSIQPKILGNFQHISTSLLNYKAQQNSAKDAQCLIFLSTTNKKYLDINTV